jgi:CRISPR-associated protein Cas5d
MFRRRLERGQHFQQPYLGCREFAADVEPAPERFAPIQPGADRPLGLMLWDFDYGAGGHVRPLFFDARLAGGILRIPSTEEVSRQNADGTPS